jgi:DNA topoisomerase VI subunit A
LPKAKTKAEKVVKSELNLDKVTELKQKMSEKKRSKFKPPSGAAIVEELPTEEIHKKIHETSRELLLQVEKNTPPVIEIPQRGGDNIIYDEDSDLLLLGQGKSARALLSLGTSSDVARTMRVLEIIHTLVERDIHATKREIFYNDVNLFKDQLYSDKIIDDIPPLLSTTRDSTHVVASAKGMAIGRLIISDSGDTIDLTKLGSGGWSITPFLDKIKIVESDAEFILVVEKDAALIRLSEAKWWNKVPCIIITGKGSADIATRSFLRKMVKTLKIPAFALMDSDPYGMYIYSVYLRGSKRLSYESPFLATPELKLLGVLSRDLDKYNIPKECWLKMTDKDIKRAKEMLKEPFVQKNEQWTADLQLMIELKRKAEIQALSSHGFEYLTETYLPQKISTGDWF